MLKVAGVKLFLPAVDKAVVLVLRNSARTKNRKQNSLSFWFILKLIMMNSNVAFKKIITV